MSGSIVGWGGAIEQSFDLVIYLWLPAEVRLARLRQREMERYGSVDPEFIAWAALYDDGDMTVRSRARHEAWLTKMRCPLLRLEADLTVEERVNQVLAKCSGGR